MTPFVWRGFFQIAALLVHDALSIREKTLGPEHPDTAESLNDLGLLLHLQDDLVQHGGSANARWRSARRRSAPSIPVRHRAFTISPPCFRSSIPIQPPLPAISHGC